jgi:hypothetical protein
MVTTTCSYSSSSNKASSKLGYSLDSKTLLYSWLANGSDAPRIRQVGAYRYELTWTQLILYVLSHAMMVSHMSHGMSHARLTS